MSDAVGGLLGGGGSESTSQSLQGYAALPGWEKHRFQRLLDEADTIITNPERFFTPLDMTDEERLAREMLQPSNIQGTVEQYLNPYRNIITRDINRAFEDGYGALKSRANEAGAFGSTRMRDAESDLERARLDAISNAMSGQYNTAYNQAQGGIANLLNFGGFERGLQREKDTVLPRGLSSAMGLMQPFLNTGNSTQTQSSNGSSGLLGSLGGFASGLGSVFGGGSGLAGPIFGSGATGAYGGQAMLAGLSAFSDKRLKENIVQIGQKNGIPIYEFNYKWDDQKYTGVMAQDVEQIMPEAVSERAGYKVVDYAKIGVEMRAV